MHLAVRKLGEDRGTQGIQVKVGAHYGEVIEEDGDIFGDAVNVAARMASLAKADQTLVMKLSLRNCQWSFVRLCVITIRSNSRQSAAG